MRKFRLLTRSDFDGLVCAILLRELDILGEIKFVHPKDVQDGKVDVGPDDILTNLPYDPRCHQCFDHHGSEALRLGTMAANHILVAGADSAARVVYDHFGGAATFPRVSAAMMAAVDKADSAKFEPEDVLDPKGWELLSFLMDARTGLGRFRDFRVSNYQLMMDLIESCRHLPVEVVLQQPDVAERVELYASHAEPFREQLRRCSVVHGNLVVLDLRGEETIYAGNRFVIYAMHQACNISIHVLWGREKANTVFAVGKSIFDRSSKTNVGALCLAYGGGGHPAAGTCQVDNADAERVLAELVARINADG